MRNAILGNDLKHTKPSGEIAAHEDLRSWITNMLACLRVTFSLTEPVHLDIETFLKAACLALIPSFLKTSQFPLPLQECFKPARHMAAVYLYMSHRERIVSSEPAVKLKLVMAEGRFSSSSYASLFCYWVYSSLDSTMLKRLKGMAL